MAFVKLMLSGAAFSALVIGCGSTTAAVPPDPALQTCEAEARGAVMGYSRTLTLAAALPTTAGAVTQWEYTRNGPNGPRPLVSRWSTLPAGQRVVFCYFDGDFANFAPPGPPGGAHLYERALLIATEAQSPWLDHIGPKATNPLTAP